jgi:mono/diheme cytochrome c family protein
MNPRLCALAGLTGVVLVVGCNKQADADSTAPGPTANTPPANASPGELFGQYCFKCHKPSGPTGAPRKGGPDLAKTAEDPEHTVDWIAEHIKNPKTHNPASRMPAFESQLTPEQIRKLAEYVLTLKS